MIYSVLNVFLGILMMQEKHTLEWDKYHQSIKKVRKLVVMSCHISISCRKIIKAIQS